MIVADVWNFLEQMAPFRTQLAFDNAGLLVGSADRPVHAVGVALDATRETVARAVEQGIDLLVTHHPVIFDPLRCVPADSVVYQLIRNNIAVISAHTNLDAAVGGVSDALAQRLGLTNVAALALPDSEGLPPMGRVGHLDHPMDGNEFARFVARQLHTRCKFTACAAPITTVAVCGGAGADLLEPAAACGARAVVTGEVKHHQFLRAAELGVCLVEAGHFETEAPVVDVLVQRLAPLCAVPVTALDQTPPAAYCTERDL